MGSNSFGKYFKITTWGESHGKAIGVVIDGCPAGISLCEEDIFTFLKKRAPGNNPYTSYRVEKDVPILLSGVFENQTTGAPISIMIENSDADSSKYESIKQLLRPGHANYTYIEKYGIFDYRGGGRASGRETACRVAAAAVAKKLLEKIEINLFAYMKKIGPHEIAEVNKKSLLQSPIFCPDAACEKKMITLIEECKERKDSIGGTIECVIENCPTGLGDPVYEKLPANLAKAILSIPACKGFEIGSGFDSTMMRGSEHNDVFYKNKDKIDLKTNFSGGTLGGITTGKEIIFRASFKPTSSIQIPQQTVDLEGKEAEFMIPKGSRHDPCVAIRAVPVVEAMAYLVIADSYLANRLAKI